MPRGLLLGEEAEASPSIGNTVARLNDVHAFGYDSAGSERIWVKFGGTPSILFGAVPDKLWARSAQKREREPKFCFFLSIK